MIITSFVLIFPDESVITKQVFVTAVFSAITRGMVHMNTDNFDKHAKANLAIYEGVMNFSKIVTAAVIVTLVLMAIFLL